MYQGNMTQDELEQWADSHQTSIIITKAIEELSIKTNRPMNKIWQNPTKKEDEFIFRGIWKKTDEDTLYWGLETFERP